MSVTDEEIRKMKYQGKKWSEVLDWIERQVGHDPEVIRWARKVWVEA